MKSSIGSPNKRDVRRFELMQQAGCLACIQLGIHENPGDVHHLLNAGKRISHQHTICLCPYHHRGLHWQQFKGKLGPSLAIDKRKFHEVFGSEEDLLWFQDEILQRIEDSFV